ncbi:MAG: hypothetical protein LC729_02910 [Acidobacteria bacterium]|nr:hypothetical protein [Acidobacteriota bacterium]
MESAGERRTVTVSAFDLVWYTRALLTTRNAIAHLPALFQAMDDGNFTELGRMADGWRTAPAPNATVFTHRCSSAASLEREQRIARERPSAALGDATDFASPEAARCPRHDNVSGTLDGDAPESNADEVIRDFPNGVHLHVDGAAHALLGLNDAATRESIVRFLGTGRLGKIRLALPALAFERRESGRARPLVAGGTIPAPSLFGIAR